MSPTPLIIDCDPGVDDAVALLTAFGTPALELLAVTTVGGNVPVDRTARNARILRQITHRCGFAWVDRHPVCRRCDQFMVVSREGNEAQGARVGGEVS